MFTNRREFIEIVPFHQCGDKLKVLIDMAKLFRVTFD
jgi:hypothetical protein